jgi:RNA-directed DNA polymerase
VHSNELDVQTKLYGIAKKARADQRCQFTRLFHLMNKDRMLECFMRLRTDAASGIDNITKQEYARNLYVAYQQPC